MSFSATGTAKDNHPAFKFESRKTSFRIELQDLHISEIHEVEIRL